MYVSVVSVPVSDQRRATAYYTSVLGFEVVAESAFGDGLSWIQLAPPGGGQATLTLVTWFDEMPPGSLRGLVLDTDDIERDHGVLVARGADLLGPPEAQPGGVFLMIRDPDGNILSLHQEGSG